MANCKACDDLRTNAPSIQVNGIDDTACNSLKNNTGFNPSTKTDNCADLEDANDCLIGNMAEKIDAYDVCDWKDFMKRFIPNVYTVFKGIICWVCGVWAAITNLQCQIRYLFKGVSKTYTDDDFVPGIGVSLQSGATVSAAPTLRIRGNTVHAQGSLTIKTKGTVSGYNMLNYWGNLGLRQVDAGDNPGMRIDGTNANPDKPGVINTPNGNYRIAILKLKKSEIPTVGRIRTGVGMFNNAACGMVTLQCRDGDAEQTDGTVGDEYPGYWGYGTAGGGKVPRGYYYIVISLSNLITWGYTGKDGDAEITFDVFTQCEINQEKIEC